MTVRAEVASVAMPIEAVLALKEGDLLRLNAPAVGGITLYADKVPVHTGRPGRSGSRRAVQVTGHMGGGADERFATPSARLGQSTAEACLGVLEMFAAGKVSLGEVTTLDDSKAAFDGVPVPAVAMAVSYVDGVTGGNVFLITLDGARLLAASMMGMDEPEDPDATELSELELSAVSEAMNQMMASAAAATSVVLGTEVEIGTPETKTFTAADAIADAYPTDPARRADGDVDLRRARAARAARAERLRRAHVERARRSRRRARRPARRAGSGRRGCAAAAPSLAGIPVRVWAELGRARMPSAQIVGLPDRRRRRARQAGRRRDRSLRQRNTLRHGPSGRRGRNRLGRAHRARARHNRNQQ